MVWLRSATWDLFWLHSGLWLIPALLLASLRPGLAEGGLVVAVFLLWLPHRFATMFNAYCSPAYSGLLRSQSWRFLGFPLAVLSGTLGFVFVPDRWLSWSYESRVQMLATIFLLANSWHFALQHYGVLSIYRQRAGQRSTAGWKPYEKSYCIFVGLFVVLWAQIGQGAEVVESSAIYHWIPRATFTELFSLSRWFIPPIVLICWLTMLVQEWRDPQRSLPKALYLTAIAGQGMLAYWWPPVLFLLLWGVQHWLVSVALTAAMAVSDDTIPANARGWYACWSGIRRQAQFTVGFLVISTVFLVPFFEIAARPASADRLPFVGGIVAVILSHHWAAQLFVAINFGTVFSHFVMDRAVFRFSHPDTRAVTGRLLFASPKAKTSG